MGQIIKSSFLPQCEPVDSPSAREEGMAAVRRQPAAAVNPDGFMEAEAREDDILSKAMRGAKEIRRAAQAEAVQAIQKARMDGERKGYMDGLKQGHEDGMRITAQKQEELKAEYARKKEELRGENAAQIAEAQDGQLFLAFTLCGRILRGEIQSSETAFLQLFKQAAAHVGETERAVLKTGPKGYEIACRHTEALSKMLNGLQESLVVKLAGTDDGLCILETPAGSVDASVHTQLQKAAQAAGFAGYRIE